MAAATHGVPHLEVTASDDMDLHSDSGLDFDDGDIDLDLDLPLPVQPQDDDVSIKDAATDAGQDEQIVNADQDDFMIDNEDFIEVDTLQYGDGVPATSGSGAPSVTAKTATPAPVEDDLIDYSDDEDDPVLLHAQEPLPEDQSEAPSAGNDQSEVQVQRGDDLDATAGNDDYSYDSHDVGQDEGVGIYETLYQPDFDQEAEAQHQVDDHTEVDDGGVQLEGFDEQADDSEHQEGDNQDRPLCETRAVTINYEGNELWLFKEHDLENSGDWLLEDTSVVHSSLSDLLQACRASLGEDISHETELGLRFDHLHNMELYEDNTACVAVSLERLLDLYYSLHSQDGNNDPESFYICLLSRPRFATLLSDIAKHADQGSGYNGFNAAVAAGETHFVDAHSGHSTEHDATEWDNDEEQHDITDSASGADDDTRHAEHDENDEDGLHDVGDEANEEEPSNEHDKEFDVEDISYLEQVPPHEEDSVTQEHADVSEEASDHDDNRGQTAPEGSPSAAKKATEEFQNDIVDYSDDEEQEDVTKPTGVVANDPSPSSSTVQGDDTLTGENGTEVTGSAQPVGESSANPDDDTYPHAEEQSSHAENHESYQDFDQTYTEENPFSGFQAGETQDYHTEADFEGFTNQDFTGYDHQDVDEELQNDFLGGDEHDGADAGDSLNIANGLTGDDDYRNLTDAPEWTADQGQTLPPLEDETLVFDDYTEHGQEEEDGMVQQPAVAASSAADPVAASSTDLHDASPQGQKRSIDEVGDLVGDALDSTDTKRPRV